MTQLDPSNREFHHHRCNGRYVLPNLAVGPYWLTAQGTGFKDYVRTGIVLQARNSIDLNIAMQVGYIKGKVEERRRPVSRRAGDPVASAQIGGHD